MNGYRHTMPGCFHQGQLPGMPSERRGKRGCGRDVSHAYMTRGVLIDQLSGMPIMRPEGEIPAGMISFSEAMARGTHDYSNFVHFYEYDDKIERFWGNPWRYVDRLFRFAGVVSTDYSTGPGIPDPVRRYNVYRNQLTGAWMQSLGMTVLCNVRCPAFGMDYFLAGVPRHCTVSVGAIGCVKNRLDRDRFEAGLMRLIQELEPESIVVVGEDSYGVFDYARECGVDLHFFHGATEAHFRGVARE